MTEFRRQTEDRIIEIQHRLIVDAECLESDRSPEFLEAEEELLDELRELELMLAAEDAESHGEHVAHRKKIRGMSS